MQKKIVLAMLLVFGIAMAAGTTEAQTPPSQSPLFTGVTFRNVQTPAAYFDLVQSVVEYDGGAFSAMEAVPYQRFFTVMQGQMSFTIGEKTEVYDVGQNLSVPPGVMAKASNEGRKAAARFYLSSLVPAWATGSTLLPGSTPSTPAPRTVQTARIAVRDVPEVVDLLQWGFRYGPGFVTPTHVMNEYHAFLITEGTTSFEYFDGSKESYSAGQGAQMYPGRPGLMANRAGSPTAWLNTWLSTPGAPVTSPRTAPAAPGPAIAPPSTGDGGLAFGIESAFPGGVYVAMIFAASAGAGLLLLTAASRRVSARRN